MKPRDVVQIATDAIDLYAVALDGTVWVRNTTHAQGWTKLPPLPPAEVSADDQVEF